jgi:hypothetical protein
MKFVQITALTAIITFSILPSLRSPIGATTLKGSYLRSCRSPHQWGNKRYGFTLRARCKRANGRGKHISQLEHTELCVGDIANINGNLRCHHRTKSESHPRHHLH